MTVTTESASETLPHWDVSGIFPALASREFGDAFDRVREDIAALRRHFDENGIRRTEKLQLDVDLIARFEATLAWMNAVLEDVRTVSAYISAFTTTNTRDDEALAKQSELQRETVELAKLGTRFEAWVGSLDVDALVSRSQAARDHEFMLRKARIGATHQMSEAEEELAAELTLSGGTAWVKLHSSVSSQVTATVRYPDGSDRTMPMSAVRALAFDPDAALRESAYRAELRGWEAVTVPLAAALNGIKGETNTLNARRHWEHSLDRALYISNIDRATLDAMHEACTESFPDFRRYLRAKARMLGNERLPWWDVFAPVGRESRTWTYVEATDFVAEQFATYSDRLAQLARRAFSESWLDAEPRDGKVDGAFCMNIRGDESRILLNFKPSLKSVMTIAHELGHAYQNVNLAGRTQLQRQIPMTLAETASIMNETIVTNAVLAGAKGDEKLAILEDDIQSACQVVVDIHSRFLFEKEMTERRAQRELSVSELNEIMLDAQRQTYGDGLDADAMHQYMWCVKGHYYSTGRPYYNFPYTFGLLYGLGLYSRYRDDPKSFIPAYDDFLASAGLDDAAGLAARFGIDVRSVAFWRSSLALIRERIDEFIALAPPERAAR